MGSIHLQDLRSFLIGLKQRLPLRAKMPSEKERGSQKASVAYKAPERLDIWKPEMHLLFSLDFHVSEQRRSIPWT